jgi:hypothetical protein
MMSKSQNNKSFVEWARQVNAQHPDILKHMLKSTNLLDRVMAKRIMKTIGVDNN